MTITSRRGTKISAKQKAVQLWRQELKEVKESATFLVNSNCKTEVGGEKSQVQEEFLKILETFYNSLE